MENEAQIGGALLEHAMGNGPLLALEANSSTAVAVPEADHDAPV